jgi:hypothetical protein
MKTALGLVLAAGLTAQALSAQGGPVPEGDVGGQVTERGTFTMDPDRQPMAIDFVMTNGPGKTIQ